MGSVHALQTSIISFIYPPTWLKKQSICVSFSLPKLSTSDKMQSFLLQNRHDRMEGAGPVCENNAGGALYIRNEEMEEALGGKQGFASPEQIFPAHCTALHYRLFPIVNQTILSIGKRTDGKDLISSSTSPTQT